MVVVEVCGVTYHMDDRIKAKWDQLKDGLLAKYDEDRFYIVDGAEGCLAGDTQIQCSRGKLSRKYSIKLLYNHYHRIPNRGKLFDLNTPTFVRSFNGKEIKLHKIKDVMYSGKKLTYLLRLNNGKKIKATATHKFLTRDGWKPLSKLKIGEELMCDNLNAHKNGRKKIKLYDIQLKVDYHPYNYFSQGIPIFDKIESIDELKVEDVYDIACEDPHHNFVANGIVVHNSGKSLFTLQQAAYIDPTIIENERGRVLPRICFSVDEFLNAIRGTKSTKEHTKVVVFDEAFRGMSSKASLSKNNKKLVECLMEARQNNLVVFIVSPSFYLLEFYGAVLRSQALFHVIKMKKNRQRYVRVFSKKDKAILYQIGVRKGWGYPRRTKFRVRFFNTYPGGKELETRYRKKKSDNFGVDMSGTREEQAFYKNAEKFKHQRAVLCYGIKQLVPGPMRAAHKKLKEWGLDWSYAGFHKEIQLFEYEMHKKAKLAGDVPDLDPKVDDSADEDLGSDELSAEESDSSVDE